MEALPLRILPDSDLRSTLEETVATHGSRAGFVVSGIGSLRGARLRFAGESESTALDGDLEILTLAGTIAETGAHLHMSVANASGHVFGGHLTYGCRVRTTAEVLLVFLPEWSFTRELGPATGFAELVVCPGGQSRRRS